MPTLLALVVRLPLAMRKLAGTERNNMHKTSFTLRTVSLLACAACAVGVTAGCSDKFSSNSAGQQASSSQSASPGSNEEYLLRMVKCMRDKGVDVSDPDSQGSVQFPQTEEATRIGNQCVKEVGPAPGVEDLSKPDVQQDLVKAAQCLRAEGYDVPDPSPEKGLQLNGEIPKDVMDKCFSSLGGNK